jgi:hypothetical protein
MSSLLDNYINQLEQGRGGLGGLGGLSSNVSQDEFFMACKFTVYQHCLYLR